MRKYFGLILIVIALLSLAIFFVNKNISPFLSESFNSNLIIYLSIFIGVSGILASLKNSTELLGLVFPTTEEKGDLSRNPKFETIHKMQSKGLEDDLHELINFLHSGVVIYTEMLEKHLQEGDYETAKKLSHQIKIGARATLNNLRSIHISIYSKILEEENLHDALYNLTAVWSRRIFSPNKSYVPIVLECPKSIEISKDLFEPILRVAGLALANAVLYSGIIENEKIGIVIDVEKAEGMLTLKVQDDGVGMNVVNDGYGITRMKQIADYLSRDGHVANLKFSSKAGKGTSVIFRVAC